MSPKSSLDRYFAKILRREGTRKTKHGTRNRNLRKLFNNRLSLFGVVVFMIITLTSVFAPVLTSYEPQVVNLRAILEPPSSTHILGTDQVGRDLFARIVYGGRVSILVGFGSALGAAIIGVSLGCITGYVGGFLDNAVLRVSEVFMAFPFIVLALLLVSIVGQSLVNLILIFSATGWAGMYRLTRAQMLSRREEEYVLALRAFGLSPFTIAYKHILPNAGGPLLVNISLSTALYILAEAALSFLGLGVPLQIPTWGNILNAAQQLRIVRESWWMWLPVGLVISLFVLSVNFIGDALRDSIDPEQQG